MRLNSYCRFFLLSHFSSWQDARQQTKNTVKKKKNYGKTHSERILTTAKNRETERNGSKVIAKIADVDVLGSTEWETIIQSENNFSIFDTGKEINIFRLYFSAFCSSQINTIARFFLSQI